MANLTGKAYYAFVQQPKPKTPKFKSTWSIDLVLDAESLKKAKELKIPIKKADGKGAHDGDYVKFSSYITEPEHTKPISEGGRKPQVLKGKEPYSGPVWNGSKANIIFTGKEFDGIVKPIPRVVQVLELAAAPEGWDENATVIGADIENELIDTGPSKTELNDDLGDL